MQVSSAQYTPRQGVHAVGGGGVSPAAVTMQMGADINSGLSNIAQMLMQNARMKYEMSADAADRAERARMFDEDLSLRRQQFADQSKLTQAQVDEIAALRAERGEEFKYRKERDSKSDVMNLATLFHNMEKDNAMIQIQREANNIPLTLADKQADNEIFAKRLDLAVQLAMKSREMYLTRGDEETKKQLAPIQQFTSKFQEWNAVDPVGDLLPKIKQVMKDQSTTAADATKTVLKQRMEELRSLNPGDPEIYSAGMVGYAKRVANSFTTSPNLSDGIFSGSENIGKVAEETLNNYIKDAESLGELSTKTAGNFFNVVSNKTYEIATRNRMSGTPADIMNDFDNAVLARKSAEGVGSVYRTLEANAKQTGMQIPYTAMDVLEAMQSKEKADAFVQKAATYLKTTGQGIGQTMKPGVTSNAPAAFQGTRQPIMQPMTQNALAAGLATGNATTPPIPMPTLQPTTRPAAPVGRGRVQSPEAAIPPELLNQLGDMLGFSGQKIPPSPVVLAPPPIPQGPLFLNEFDANQYGEGPLR